MKKKNLNNVFTFGYFRPWYNVPSHVKQFIKIIKYCFERITKGYCAYDRYDIDSWLLETLPNMLNEFAEKTHSHPYGFSEGVVNNLYKSFKMKNILNENEEKDYKAWCAYIREIAEHLNNAKKDYYDEYKEDLDKPCDEVSRQRQLDFQKYKEEELHKGLVMLESVFFHLWD